MKIITKEDILACWPDHYMAYLIEILNGTYSGETAKEDLESLIGSKYDLRETNTKEK